MATAPYMKKMQQHSDEEIKSCLEWLNYEMEDWKHEFVQDIKSGEYDDWMGEIAGAVSKRLVQLGLSADPFSVQQGASATKQHMSYVPAWGHICRVDAGGRRTKWESIYIRIDKVNAVKALGTCVQEGPWSYQGKPLMGRQVRVPINMLEFVAKDDADWQQQKDEAARVAQERANKHMEAEQEDFLGEATNPDFICERCNQSLPTSALGITHDDEVLCGPCNQKKELEEQEMVAKAMEEPSKARSTRGARKPIKAKAGAGRSRG